MPRRPLEDILVAAGALSSDQLRIARLEQQKSKEPMGRLLVRLGFVSESTLRDAQSESLGQRSIDLEHAVVDPAALKLVPRTAARRHRVLPLAFDAETNRLLLAAADTNDLAGHDRIRALLPEGGDLELLLAGETEIDRAIDRHYGHELSIDGILREIESGESDWRHAPGGDESYGQPVVRLIDALLTDAVKRDASDIHFEPEAGFLRIRYRVDGMLRHVRALHGDCWPAMAVRLKVMSGMNIAETRAPQDGRIGLNISGRAIDFRVAAQPTLHGENIVVRVLDRHKGIVPLERLGLDTAQLAQLKRMMARPEGIVLVTGPTGSGKTTTLYSILSDINAENIHIMTLEDPVEYPLPLIRQTSISETTKLDFANGIRSMMRQDPDVILIGEIRDADTASMAFRAAMTGHQVYATLHSNSAVGAIPRLLDIGVPPGVLSGNIIGIVAQRLVRRLCPHCRIPYAADVEERRLLLPAGDEPLTLYRPAGCGRCNFQGYRGRLALMELLRIDGELDALIAEGAPLHRLRAEALGKGFVSLAEDGLRRVREGATSLAELGRVVDLTDRR